MICINSSCTNKLNETGNIFYGIEIFDGCNRPIFSDKFLCTDREKLETFVCSCQNLNITSPYIFEALEDFVQSLYMPG